MSAHGCRLVRLVALFAALVVLAASPARVGAQTPPTAHHPGKWTTAATWPGRTPSDSVHAVHMALLRGDTLFARPNSCVLAWGVWTPTVNDGGLWAWNPTTDVAAQAASNLTALTAQAPPYNLFCAGHSSVPDASGDLLVVGGTERGHTGENLSARFNTRTRAWVVAPMGARRWYANATAVPGDALPGGTPGSGRIVATAGWAYDHMVLFGGRRQSDGTLMNDVRRYAITDAGHWDPALTGSGPGWPEPRESHTLADQVKGPYYLFGGKDAAGTRNDVWQLLRKDTDLDESYRWKQLTPASLLGPPSTRWRHAAVVIPAGLDSLATMYVHGGENTEGPTPITLGDLWKLEWRTDLNPDQWQWFELTDSTTGTAPSARSGHSAIWDKPNRRMILYGGQNADGTITDQNVYVLKVPIGAPRTWTVAPLAPGSPVPAARTRHAMASDLTASTATGIVFGGMKAGSVLSDELWEFSVSPSDSVTWKLWPPGSPAPAARAGASAILYEMHPRSFVLLGGELASGGVDSTVWEFRRDTNSWSTHSALPHALTGHIVFREHRPLTPLQPEVYNPDNNTWSLFGQTKWRTSYHMIFHAADGKLYSPGPNIALRDSTWRFDLSTGQWSLYATNNTAPMDGTISGILYRPDQIMKCGGSGYFEQGKLTRSLQTGLSPSPAWRASVDTLGLPRTDHMLNMLPTGEVLASGGRGQDDNGNLNPDDDLPRKRPEIWDPNYTDGIGIGYWYGALGNDTLAAEPVTRTHHSSSVMLPDGRLLSGGGWDPHPSTVNRTVDQYSPPYLFQPAAGGGAAAFRPRLQGAQDHITWGTTFEVACLDPVAQACLIRAGASTHAFNQDNRYVPLTIASQVGHKVTLHSPLNANVAPPGDYLLFVLRDEGGRKVPSIARWVNVGPTLTHHATWDTLPPAVINNLGITAWTPTSHTLEWVAPSDAGDGSLMKATKYELRYRVGAPMPTLEDFFQHGTSVTNLPTPGAAGTGHTFTVNHLATELLVYFRIISRDGAGSDRNWSAMSNEVSHPQSGCPFMDTRTASGWEVENSILGRSLSGALALDSYRLRHAPEVRNGRVQLRVRENEQERTTLDQLRLIAVDHAPGVRAYAMGDQVVLGTRSAAARVTTAAGVDITALLDGAGAGFSGGPGDTLLVEFAAGEEHAVVGEEQSTQEHDPFHMDDGGKCPPDCGYPLWSPADRMSATSIDAQVLGSSGILLQTPDGRGGWRTVLTRYPREHADEAVLEGFGHASVRMVFVGRHRVRFVGRLHEAGVSFSAHKLPLLAARHTRFGDVASAMDTTGNLTSVLTPGDTMHLEFGWTPVPEGQVRELMLLSHGVYTASLPATLRPVPPEQFAIQVPRPNPFAASTLLRFDLPVGRQVQLEVLDAQGRRVRVLANHYFTAGHHAIEWDGRNEAGGQARPGIYFYRFEAGEFRAKGRMTRVP